MQELDFYGEVKFKPGPRLVKRTSVLRGLVDKWWPFSGKKINSTDRREDLSFSCDEVGNVRSGTLTVSYYSAVELTIYFPTNQSINQPQHYSQSSCWKLLVRRCTESW